MSSRPQEFAEELLPDGGVGPVRPARSHKRLTLGGVGQGTGLSFSVFAFALLTPQSHRAGN